MPDSLHPENALLGRTDGGLFPDPRSIAQVVEKNPWWAPPYLMIRAIASASGCSNILPFVETRYLGQSNNSINSRLTLLRLPWWGNFMASTLNFSSPRCASKRSIASTIRGMRITQEHAGFSLILCKKCDTTSIRRCSIWLKWASASALISKRPVPSSSGGWYFFLFERSSSASLRPPALILRHELLLPIQGKPGKPASIRWEKS